VSTETDRLYSFINNAAVQDIKAAIGETSPPSKKEAPTVAKTAAPTNLTQKFDPAALLDSIQETDEAITRSRGGGEKYANNPYVPHMNRSRETGKVLQLPVPGHSVKELVGYLRDAADKGGHGLKLAVPKDHATDGSTVVVKFQAVEKRKHTPRANKGAKAECPVCHESVSVTADNKFRVHGPRDARCPGSGSAVSGE